MSNRISVRSLCEFTDRIGDIDHRYTPAPTAVEGIEGHQRLQKRRGASYQSEYPIEQSFDEITVRGRCDGFDRSKQLVEEIKTYRGDLERQSLGQRNLHLAQLRSYGAMICLEGRYTKEGQISAHPPSSIPFLALGAWILAVGWFGFNVMSAQTIDKISGLVAMNSLMAMVGGTLAAWVVGRNDPGFVYNGPLAGLVAVCAGSDLMHPLGALFVGLVAGGLFVYMFTLVQNRWKLDDVLGVWPLHGLCGLWGGLAAGIFGTKAFGGIGGVTFIGQLIGSALGVGIALLGGFVVYGTLKAVLGIRMSQEEEFEGADLSVHRISATPDREPNW